MRNDGQRDVDLFGQNRDADDESDVGGGKLRLRQALQVDAEMGRTGRKSAQFDRRMHFAEQFVRVAGRTADEGRRTAAAVGQQDWVRPVGLRPSVGAKLSKDARKVYGGQIHEGKKKLIYRPIFQSASRVLNEKQYNRNFHSIFLNAAATLAKNILQNWTESDIELIKNEKKSQKSML